MSLKKYLKDWKISLMIALLIASLIIIHPNFDREGAIVSSVSLPASNYIQKDVIITGVNGILVSSAADFNLAISSFLPNDSISITYKEKGLF
ncbi:MAG: hypothetical protein PHG04_02250, partial [Candidatus Nanoarchaeia archaeon]|nr:hypothetical protein [Candidatus Nanoarchaeia archaeon]